MHRVTGGRGDGWRRGEGEKGIGVALEPEVQAACEHVGQGHAGRRQQVELPKAVTSDSQVSRYSGSARRISTTRWAMSVLREAPFKVISQVMRFGRLASPTYIRFPEMTSRVMSASSSAHEKRVVFTLSRRAMRKLTASGLRNLCLITAISSLEEMSREPPNRPAIACRLVLPE